MKIFNGKYALTVGFAIALIIFALTGWMAYQNMNGTIESDARENHTYEMIHELDSLLTALVDAETGQRGLIITGDESYLKHYKRALTKISEQQASLRKLTKDDSQQQKRLNSIFSIVEKRLAIIQKILEARRSQGFQVASQMVITNHGQELMNNIRKKVTEAQDNEKRLLKERSATKDANMSRTLQALQVSGAVGFTILIVVFILLKREIVQHSMTEVELRWAKDEAEAATASKSQFLANMSHELRTPMTGVLGMLDLVLLDNLDAEQRERIEISQRSALALVRILNDILDLARIEADKLLIEEKPFSVRKCVENTCNVFLPIVKDKGIDLDCTVANELPEILVGDQARITQILTNLAGNAVKFTSKGKIELRITAGGSILGNKREVTFTVIDSGIGIPDDKKHLLFHSFSQVDESHSRSYGGTGLGLAISKELVERMGGSITFTSEENVGSTFTFTLSLAEAPRENEVQLSTKPQSIGDPSTASAGESIPRILLAEDDPTIRRVLGGMLKRANYHLDFAEDGQKAIEMWKLGGYDLVLMDVQMPRLNGFEATSVIRDQEQAKGGHIPIIAMTAHAGKEDEERCLAAGMDAYIAKPIDFGKTLQVIGETLKMFH